MIDFSRKKSYDYDDLISLVALLRADGGCEWDRAQTHASIRRNFLEEAYEACEAMDENDPPHLQEELGDVLLQVVFHTGIEQDAGNFSMAEVCDGVCKKLIERHPHLFAGGERRDWDQLKREQRGNQTVAQAMAEISKALPALTRADKLRSKAEKSGLLRNEPATAVAQLHQEITELERAAASGEAIPAALGAVLFAAVGVARGCGLDAEQTLHSFCKCFTDSFSQIEQKAAQKINEKKEVPL